MYSDQLVAYLFNEIDPDTKQAVERELATNKELQVELEDLRSSLDLLNNDKPLSPSPQAIKNILEESKDSESILAD